MLSEGQNFQLLSITETHNFLAFLSFKTLIRKVEGQSKPEKNPQRNEYLARTSMPFSMSNLA